MTYDPPSFQHAGGSKTLTAGRLAPEPSGKAALAASTPSVPKYMHEVYSWAYLSPVGQWVFDRSVSVNAILWGNADRLIQSVEDELEAGQKVLQAACVYGDFSKRMASKVGPEGRLDVIDIAPNQVRQTRVKLSEHPQASVRIADAREPGVGELDVAICFFLLHEVPADYKPVIVNALFDSVRPGGKVVFVDYHRMAGWHPLRPIMWSVYRLLEPFAQELVDGSIPALAAQRDDIEWGPTQTFFGGLYQKIVAHRR
ncbi:rhodoquinone biosynthesis methyltransferase RquA [Roseospirillum parvum]|uniref:Methyltransferase domain-containing protein n=1 Tax=Roseospirillum parvum TaxID=83401 RepID=A0A1G8B3S1_9PROT|nr:rhodoquinone biosynthesis methyltransferase RquA [Roseospirillum parvum]SDH27902.1 Methyltransferase domain-containing protein [Roseospirillum parvum]